MQAKGVVTYLVLEDDHAWHGYDHARYYREMIARFGYLPALIFNFNEEYNENYKLPQALEYLQQLADLDPYDHPRGIHNVNTPSDDYIDCAADRLHVHPDGQSRRPRSGSAAAQPAGHRLDRAVPVARPPRVDGRIRRRPTGGRPPGVVERVSGGWRVGGSRPAALRPADVRLGTRLDRTGRHANVHGIAAVLGNGAGQRRRAGRQGVLSGKTRRKSTRCICRKAAKWNCSCPRGGTLS